MKVLYHASCSDGFCAAWVAQKVYPDAEFIPVQYQQDPPDIAGHDVMIVDFSYKREVMEEIKKQAKSLVVLDHHKTAQEELQGLDYCIFDMTKSGAKLTWEYLFPNAPAPWLVNYVEDRDLWLKKLPNSDEINIAVRSYKHDFAVWDELAQMNVDTLIAEGRSIIRYRDGLIQSHMKYLKPLELDGFNGLGTMCSVVGFIGSDLMHEILTTHNCDFAYTYFINDDGKECYSLRSNKIDVSEIAARRGGGGHKAAAGFTKQ